MAYNAIPPSVISTVNSTAAALGSNAVFTGTSENVIQYASATILVFADQASATDGLSIQQSSNGTNWDSTDVYSIPITTAGNAKTFAVQITGSFLRVVYTNGATASTVFRLQTIYHYIAPPTSSVRPQDARTNDNDMQESLAYQMLFNGTTWDRARGDTTNGAFVQVKAALPTGANTIGAISNTTFNSTQSGTWTVQPGNTQNTTPWLVREFGAPTPTITQVTPATTSTTIKAANTARRALVLYNGGTSDAYIAYGATASSTAFTILLPSLATTTIRGEEYNGLVTGIWVATGGNNMQITEIV